MGFTNTKYRVKEFVDKYGNTRYKPQQKVLFFWLDFKDDYNRLDLAEWVIEWHLDKKAKQRLPCKYHYYQPEVDNETTK